MEPPRRRGEVRTFCTAKGIIRITPAWAGKSLHFFHFLGGGKDHPRMGGEKLMGRPRRSVGAGSPPRRRGKALHRVKNDLRYGITPAWAGKSTVVLPTPGYLWDHPRVGGEKLLQFALPLLLTGSPPRGRGKVDTDCILNRTERITPAWAGKSCFGEVCVDGLEDHPRVGGEKSLMSAHFGSPMGSPPRRRGKAHSPQIC